MNQSCLIYEWVMSHVNESRHVWISHVTYERVMSRMKESRLSYESIMSLIWMSHVKCEWVMSQLNESCHIWSVMSSCHICEWVMSHMNKSCHIWMNHVADNWVMSHVSMSMCRYMTHSYVTHMIYHSFMCHTYEWVIYRMMYHTHELVTSHTMGSCQIWATTMRGHAFFAANIEYGTPAFFAANIKYERHKHFLPRMSNMGHVFLTAAGAQTHDRAWIIWGMTHYIRHDSFIHNPFIYDTTLGLPQRVLMPSTRRHSHGIWILVWILVYDMIYLYMTHSYMTPHVTSHSARIIFHSACSCPENFIRMGNDLLYGTWFIYTWPIHTRHNTWPPTVHALAQEVSTESLSSMGQVSYKACHLWLVFTATHCNTLQHTAVTQDR